MLHSITMPTAIPRTSKLDRDLGQAQNSGKVNLPLLEILKLLKAHHFFLRNIPFSNALTL